MTRSYGAGARRDGAAFAVLAAACFGVTTPFIKLLGHGVGPFSTAALLYGGAAIVSTAGRSRTDVPIGRVHLPRIVVVTALGAVLGPASLAWGLQRIDATTASLLLNLEAVFTVLLARVLYAEPLGRRVSLAVLATGLGGALLVTGPRSAGEAFGGVGALAVLVACLAWASDSALTRPLSDLDPAQVVLWKASLGAVLSTGAAALLREAAPPVRAVMALVLCGAIGYGISLRLYLGAQRRIGAARTGAIFAVAPFVGALVGWTMGDRGREGVELAAGALFAAAVYLHLTETHGHGHRHDATEHEHAHRHDDGHHAHTHEPPVMGEHSHRHRHETMDHEHAHGLDIHHRHDHG